MSNLPSSPLPDFDDSGLPASTGRIKSGVVLGLLLAAGRGSRFDPSGEKSKLLHTLEGMPIVCHTAANLLDVCTVVLAVIRPQSPELRLPLELMGCQVIECPEAHLGMGHSLAWGLTEAEKIYQADILVVMLADMPYVQSSTIQTLIGSIHENEQAVAPEFMGRRGNPWVFGKLHFQALKSCTGDRGAAAVLDSQQVRLIEVSDPGVLRDIDSPSDILAATSATAGTTTATTLTPKLKPMSGSLPKP